MLGAPQLLVHDITLPQMGILSAVTCERICLRGGRDLSKRGSELGANLQIFHRNKTYCLAKLTY
jgi:hypothetical protein